VGVVAMMAVGVMVEVGEVMVDMVEGEREVVRAVGVMVEVGEVMVKEAVTLAGLVVILMVVVEMAGVVTVAVVMAEATAEEKAVLVGREAE